MNKTITILAVAAALAFCVHMFSDNKADVDLWGNTGFVKAPAWSEQYQRTNTYSFTDPDHPWVNHEWLSEYVFHVVYSRLGNPGLLALKILLGLCVAGIINACMKHDFTSGAMRFLYFLLVISTMGYGFSTRPHHFTYLLVAVLLFLLKQHKRFGLLLLAISPSLGLLWANLHGAFFVGMLLLCAFGALELAALPLKRHDTISLKRALMLAATIVLFFCGSLINPYSIHIWAFIFRSAAKFRPYLSEWGPIHPIEHFSSHADFMVLVLITATAIIFSKKKELTSSGILVLGLTSAVIMRRNIPLFAIAAGCLAPPCVDDAIGKKVSAMTSRIPRKLVAALLTCFLAASVFYAFTFNKKNPFQIEIEKDKFPVDVVRFMESNRLAGNALVFFDWAELCIWHLHPDCRMFLDGRFLSAYSEKTIDTYFDFIYRAEEWSGALTDYPTDIVLLHHGNPVYKDMLNIEGWTLVLEDNISGLFLKNDIHAECIARLKGQRGTAGPTTDEPAYFP